MAILESTELNQPDQPGEEADIDQRIDAAIAEVYLPPDDPRLREVASPVDPSEINTPEFQAKLEKLRAALELVNGAGIAANQIGIMDRVFMYDLSAGDDYEPPEDAGDKPDTIVTVINPEIIDQSDELVYDDAFEGCLSIAGGQVAGRVGRPKWITFKGLDAQGNPLTSIDEHGNLVESVTEHGYLARGIHHENDHLDGVLFTDRIEDEADLAWVVTKEENEELDSIKRDDPDRIQKRRDYLSRHRVTFKVLNQILEGHVPKAFEYMAHNVVTFLPAKDSRQKLPSNDQAA